MNFHLDALEKIGRDLLDKEEEKSRRASFTDVSKKQSGSLGSDLPEEKIAEEKLSSKVVEAPSIQGVASPAPKENADVNLKHLSSAMEVLTFQNPVAAAPEFSADTVSAALLANTVNNNTPRRDTTSGAALTDDSDDSDTSSSSDSDTSSSSSSSSGTSDDDSDDTSSSDDSDAEEPLDSDDDSQAENENS